MSKLIRNSINLVPYSQAQTDLFKKVCELIDINRDEFETILNDVSKKYTEPSSVSRNVVEEVFRENGLPSIVDLFNTFEEIDYNTILGFSSYITLLKGTRKGYELVLRLIGFNYTLQEWWEQTPKGKPNTFSIDILLSSSDVESPYETFQKVKKFTAEYVFPTIDPLGYTFNFDFDAVSISLSAAYDKIYYTSALGVTTPELIYGPSGFVLLDELGQAWAIRVNKNGELRAFRSLRPPIRKISFISGIVYYEIRVTSEGEIYAERVDSLGNEKQYVILMDFTKRDWYVYIDLTGRIIVSEMFSSDDLLLTEAYGAILLESGEPLAL